MSLHTLMFRLLLALALMLACLPAAARGHGGTYSHHDTSYSHPHTGYAYHYRSHAHHSSPGHYTPRTTYRSIARPYRSHSHYRTHAQYSRHPNTRKAFGVRRDAHGRIARSREAKWIFKRSHPCPSTGRSSGRCPGYVIDHVRALKHGGADAPGNMQWQTMQAARAKDRWE